MSAPTVLIIDCYDSFTFNLYQQVGKLGGCPVVFTCDTPLSRSRKLPVTGSSSHPGPARQKNRASALRFLIQ